MNNIIYIALTAILVENFVVVKFLGICPFLGVSKKLDTALGMGMAVIFVMSLASAITWLVNSLILVPFELDYLQTIAFILVIASLVQVVEMFLQRYSQGLYQALGIYLPLITTNCAVLGVTLLNIDKGYNFAEAVSYGATAGIGFTLAMVLMAGVRERLILADVPKPLQGFPIALISAGLIAIAFMGFSGIKI